jgi:hypothetical protein
MSEYADFEINNGISDWGIDSDEDQEPISLTLQEDEILRIDGDCKLDRNGWCKTHKCYFRSKCKQPITI